MKRPPAAGWLDPALRDLGPVAAEYGLDAVRLADWIAPRLAEFRMKRDADEAERVPRSEEIKALARLETALADAFAALDRRTLSAAATAELDAAAHRRDRALWRHIAESLRTDLQLARSCAGAAREAFEAMPAKPGRPSAARRDALLGELVAFIEPELGSFGRACEAAADVLTRCGVLSPADPREVEKIVREKSG